MKISTYIKSLVPALKKESVLKDLDSYRVELNDINAPAMQSAAGFFKNWAFKDAGVDKFDHYFSQNVKSKFRGNFVIVLAGITQQLKDNISVIYHLISDEFDDNIVKEGITYRKAALLQLHESVGLFLRYERTLMQWVYSQETMAIVGKSGDTPVLSKGQLQWLDANRSAFFLACNILGMAKTDIENKVNKITDAVYVEGNDDVIASTSGKAAIDPFSFFIVGTTFNVIYHARMYIADWQINRYKAAKEEQRALSYRLLNLKELSEGRNDAKIEKEILEIEGRLTTLRAKIAKEEEEYAK